MTDIDKKEIIEFDIELADYEGYPITCIVHGIENGKLDIETHYSSDLSHESEQIKSIISSIIVQMIDNSNNDVDDICKFNLSDIKIKPLIV